MMDLKYFEGRKIYVKLISDRVYSGSCESVNYIGIDTTGTPIFMFQMIDKFGLAIAFSSKEVKFIEEEK